MDTSFNQFWNYWYPRITTFSRSFWGLSHEDREDGVQEVLIKLWEKQDSYNPRWALSTWVYRIARNHFVDKLRNQQKIMNSVENLDQPGLENLACPHSDPQRTEELREKWAFLAEGLRALEDVDQQILHLRYAENLGYREIGKVLDIKVGTLKSRCHRSLGKLSIHLSTCENKSETRCKTQCEVKSEGKNLRSGGGIEKIPLGKNKSFDTSGLMYQIGEDV